MGKKTEMFYKPKCDFSPPVTALGANLAFSSMQETASEASTYLFIQFSKKLLFYFNQLYA